MTKYLVTGAAGFIGSNIVEELVARGAEVRALDNLSTGKASNVEPFLDRIEFVEGDLNDSELLRRVVRGVDYVLHQAALPSVPRSIADPLSSHEANATGTLKLLIAARDEGVKRVVYASSSSVYGDSPTLPKRRGYADKPLSPYAVNKLAAEQYCRVFAQSVWFAGGGAEIFQCVRSQAGSQVAVRGGDTRVYIIGVGRGIADNLWRWHADA